MRMAVNIKLEKTYTTSAALTVLFQDLWSLVYVAFLFTPAGIEILKPDREYILKSGDMQGLLLNVAQVSMEYSNYILERVLKKEDYDTVMANAKNREALGRKLLEKKPQSK